MLARTLNFLRFVVCSLPFIAGCPSVTVPGDSALGDAFEEQVVAEIDNDAQLCELTHSELLRVCEVSTSGLDLPGPRVRTCTDGTAQPFYESLEQCVDSIWSFCEASAVCRPPVSATVRCNRAIVTRCLEGVETEDWRVQCQVETPPDCTIDRSLALNEP